MIDCEWQTSDGNESVNKVMPTTARAKCKRLYPISNRESAKEREPCRGWLLARHWRKNSTQLPGRLKGIEAADGSRVVGMMVGG